MCEFKTPPWVFNHKVWVQQLTRQYLSSVSRWCITLIWLHSVHDVITIWFTLMIPEFWSTYQQADLTYCAMAQWVRLPASKQELKQVVGMVSLNPTKGVQPQSVSATTHQPVLEFCIKMMYNLDMITLSTWCHHNMIQSDDTRGLINIPKSWPNLLCYGAVG